MILTPISLRLAVQYEMCFGLNDPSGWKKRRETEAESMSNEFEVSSIMTTHGHQATAATASEFAALSRCGIYT